MRTNPKYITQIKCYNANKQFSVFELHEISKSNNTERLLTFRSNAIIANVYKKKKMRIRIRAPHFKIVIMLLTFKKSFNTNEVYKNVYYSQIKTHLPTNIGNYLNVILIR